MGDLIGKLLAQARKFGAAVILATQFVGQLETSLRDELLKNTNQKFCLLVSSSDAREAVKMLPDKSLTEDDVAKIEKFCGYASLRVHSAPQPPFYFRTLAPIWFREEPKFFPVDEKPVCDMAEKYNAIGLVNYDEAVTQLQMLDEKTFWQVINEQNKYGDWLARALVADTTMDIPESLIYDMPHLTERVKRGVAASRARFGTPRWYLEAYYRRTRISI
jgi:hypothetical protein